ncbi:unnamed protein product [Polarella glacialis]|uniref:Uncharacterized protein n=1 Tax=Polarella glacialis TaxID=89957 RepID=A0A813HT57_POLGL|nr:unnamed protein product [Polarella glacialis]
MNLKSLRSRHYVTIMCMYEQLPETGHRIHPYCRLGSDKQPTFPVACPTTELLCNEVRPGCCSGAQLSHSPESFFPKCPILILGMLKDSNRLGGRLGNDGLELLRLIQAQLCQQQQGRTCWQLPRPLEQPNLVPFIHLQLFLQLTYDLPHGLVGLDIQHQLPTTSQKNERAGIQNTTTTRSQPKHQIFEP